MKVLILSCSTGEGHNSAAKAYMDYLVSRGVETDFRDVLSFAGKNATTRASKVYNSSLQHHLFGFIYKIGGLVSDWTIGMRSPVYWANKKYCRRLGEYIQANGFDAIVCTHIFAADSVSELKDRGVVTQPTMLIMTDYTAIPFTKDSSLDWYLIPHEDVIDFCVRHGLVREKLLPWGIPVRMDFYKPKTEREEARALCASKFGFMDPGKPWFLLMTGSMGFGRIRQTAKAVVKKYGDGIELAIVCGYNEKLQGELSSLAAENPGVHVIGYTGEVSLLMDACDVLFTKPGGLSSTEAAIKNIPIVHTNPIPGCETCNAEFFSSRNMSFYSKDIDRQVEAAGILCKAGPERSRMLAAQTANTCKDTCARITELLLGIK